MTEPEELAERFNVSRESLTHLNTYADLLLKWNRRMNLVGPSTITDIWKRHFVDSLQLGSYLPSRCNRLVDLGSGAGFPGLPLSIVHGIETMLVESSIKKAAFLSEVLRHTGAPATVHNDRIEQLPANLLADVVVARALAPLPKLLGLAFPLLEKGARGLFLKGQDIEVELTESTKYWKMHTSQFPSLTDPNGVILVVERIERA